LFIALGFLSALFSFVPYLGPVAAAIPAVLIGLAQSPTMALYVVLLYLGVQTLESYLITPQIVQRAINLPAAGVLVMQLLFGVFFGILGVAFASPISATILTIIEKTVHRVDLSSEHGRL
jgi:predicted PurR-regulated permease PerM